MKPVEEGYDKINKKITKNILNAVANRLQNVPKCVSKVITQCSTCLVQIQEKEGRWVECKHKLFPNKQLKQKDKIKDHALKKKSKLLTDPEKYMLDFKKDQLLISSLIQDTKKEKKHQERPQQNAKVCNKMIIKSKDKKNKLVQNSDSRIFDLNQFSSLIGNKNRVSFESQNTFSENSEVQTFDLHQQEQSMGYGKNTIQMFGIANDTSIIKDIEAQQQKQANQKDFMSNTDVSETFFKSNKISSAQNKQKNQKQSQQQFWQKQQKQEEQYTGKERARISKIHRQQLKQKYPLKQQQIQEQPQEKDVFLLQKDQQQPFYSQQKQTQTSHTNCNQSTMTETQSIFKNQENNQKNMINFSQFKQCTERFYSLLTKGKAQKLSSKYQTQYREYIKLMQDKFMRSRQTHLCLESSVEQLERKMDSLAKNSISHSGYNSKRSSLIIEASSYAFISSINQQMQKQKQQQISKIRPDSDNDYLRMLIVQAQAFQKQFMNKNEDTVEQLCNHFKN